MTLSQVTYSDAINSESIVSASRKGEDTLTPEERHQCSSRLGGLNFVATQTRPDIAVDCSFASSLLGREGTAATAKRIAGIVKEVQRHKVVLTLQALPLKDLTMDLFACHDAAYGCHLDGGSQGGVAIVAAAAGHVTQDALEDGTAKSVAIGLLYWRSNRVRRICRSS